MSLFQSNLRKQIRNLLKILNFVKIIHYYSKLFTSLLRHRGRRDDHARAGHHRDDGGLLRVRTQNQLSSRWLLLAVSRICTNMAFRLPTWVHTGHHRDNGRILRVRTESAQLSVTVISGFKNMCQYGSPLTVMGAHRIPPIIFI